jgi:hypothetical protein
MTGRGHAFLDRASTASGLLMRDRSKYFAETLDSATIAEHLDAITVEPFPVTSAGVHELRATSAVGVLDPACLVARWAGPDRPSLIIHHGNNERPFAFGRSAKNFLGKALLLPEPPDANVYVLRAAFHAGTLRQYMREIRSLERFVALLATSTALVEGVVDAVRAAGSPRVVVSGLSLGGWVTNLHRAHHGTADAYVPVFAGAALAEVFLSTPYRRLTSRRALAQPERLREVLTFEDDFMAVASDDVFPLMARYDQYIDLDRQRRCYGDRPVAVLDKGHVTGGLDAAALRAHVLGHVCRQAGVCSSAGDGLEDLAAHPFGDRLRSTDELHALKVGSHGLEGLSARG